MKAFYRSFNLFSLSSHFTPLPLPRDSWNLNQNPSSARTHTHNTHITLQIGASLLSTVWVARSFSSNKLLFSKIGTRVQKWLCLTRKILLNKTMLLRILLHFSLLSFFLTLSQPNVPFAISGFSVNKFCSWLWHYMLHCVFWEHGVSSSPQVTILQNSRFIYVYFFHFFFLGSLVGSC